VFSKFDVGTEFLNSYCISLMNFGVKGLVNSSFSVTKCGLSVGGTWASFTRISLMCLSELAGFRGKQTQFTEVKAL
jgi:hypothetical protein